VNPGEVAFTDYRPFDLDEIEPEPFESRWKALVAGMRGMTRYNLFDGKLKFRLGGKIQADGTVGSGSAAYEEVYLPIESNFNLNTLSIFAVGRVYDFNFNVAFDFGADWGIDSAWIEGSEGGLEVWGRFLGKLRLGLINEPFSLQRQVSGFNIGPQERSLPVQTIAPGTNLGAMVHDSGPAGRFTWAVGLFSVGQSNDKNASNSKLSLTGRISYLPEYKDDGRRLLHVGASVSSRSPIGGDTRYRSRPEARFVDYLVDTGTIDAGNVTLWGLEVATIQGPLWAAAEYIQSDLTAADAGDPSFSGAYAEVGYFLTGENRPYRTNSGTFDRVLPRSKYTKGVPFRKENGGAWEVLGRISTIDLSDGLVEGGEMTDFTAALNWYLNATARVSVNYVYARPQDRGHANIFVLRVQYQPW
jgi:phosphate-selective porin OprO/OprP